jgi:hypothetical protein
MTWAAGCTGAKDKGQRYLQKRMICWYELVLCSFVCGGTASCRLSSQPLAQAFREVLALTCSTAHCCSGPISCCTQLHAIRPTPTSRHLR